jgi:hypothetical protein
MSSSFLACIMPPWEIVTNSLSNEMKHRSLAFSQKIVDE